MFLTTKRPGILAGAALLGCLSYAGQAQAGSITFDFNCKIDSATVCTPVAGVSFGTLKLTDSTVDANRVDIDVTLNKANILALYPAFTGLNNFFLNYDRAKTPNYDFKLVGQSDVAGTFKPTIGNATLAVDDQGPFQTLDFKLDPDGSADMLTYSASLALVYKNGSPLRQETNLDVSMFDLKDENGVLYAAFDTLPNNNRFRFGSAAYFQEQAAPQAAPVPEPATLVLLGPGLLAAVYLARRRALNK